MKTINYSNDFAFQTDTGRVRLSNQDQTTVLVNKFNDVLMLVADGMGGHNRGDYASKITIDFIVEEFSKRKRNFSSILGAKIWLQYVVSKVNKSVFNEGESSPENKGMGTTLVCALIHGNNVIILNAGDSRAYIYKDSKLVRVSEDQSYVEYMKRSGQISEEEANKSKDKNILLNALGIYPSISFNSKIYPYVGEPILLCSDGLFNEISDEEITNIINKKISAKDIVESLINAANIKGGRDNISAAFYIRRSHD